MVAIKVKDKPHCCLHKVTVVHFEVDTKVWGHETSGKCMHFHLDKNRLLT